MGKYQAEKWPEYRVITEESNWSQGAMQGRLREGYRERQQENDMNIER